MARDLLNRYVWIVETIRRHKSITREELNRRWRNSQYGDGADLPRRTFYNYRNAIEELFGISIGFNPGTYEYYIAGDENPKNGGRLTDWVINSATMSNVLADMQDISDKVFLEEVPSARDFLANIVQALKGNHPVRFDYHPYTRTLPTKGVTIHPYFIKLFRQRWYMTGLNTADSNVKTYALDRMDNLSIGTDTFHRPENFNADDFVRDAFGIIFNEGVVHRVVLKVNSRRAKYFRALPLHHSQEEAIHDDFSIFSYTLKVTPDLVQELLSYGPEITVIEPRPLKAMITNSLNETLKNYR